jgi:hypothetical protein
MTFNLQYSEAVKGVFNPGKLNLMMVMQVNCPGCFLYGIPEMKNLHHRFGEQISFFVLATAFEDFELNTTENARRLVTNGILVGETKKVFQQNQLSKDYASIPFPLLVDKMVAKEELHHRDFAEQVLASRQGVGFENGIGEWAGSLNAYFRNYDQCGFTFASNLLQGTPTFVLFNKQMEILLSWFGHADEGAVVENLKRFLLTNH